MLVFDWDEEKRLLNMEKHKIDFLDADLLFEGLHFKGLAKFVKGEQHLATGMLNDNYVTAIFVYRNDAIRIISIRSARRGERKKYQALFSG
jgi:uncharacterized DUF497 family protein